MSDSRDLARKARDMSRAELLRLYYYTEQNGLETVIIGGWAVYAYNPYLESVDIDVVVKPNDFEQITTLAQEYCGWIPEAELVDETFSRYSKPIDAERILLDMMSTNFENTFHEDRTKRLPFALCLQEGNFQRRFIDSIYMAVPVKELLLLYKLKAYRDRLYRLGTETELEERMRLQTKITKDLSDIISLMDPGYGALDVSALKGIIAEYGLHFLGDILENLPSQTEAIYQYRNVSTEDVVGWTAKLREAFS